MRVFIVSSLVASALATQFTFTNKCGYTINLRAAFGKYVCDISSGQTNTCTQNIAANQLGIFKHTETNEANLIEYSTINNGGTNAVWYDVSNIPPGPGNCNSYENCKAVTGKTGYNVPVTVTPQTNAGQGSCRELRVTSADSSDAYLFPADNAKTHACPIDTAFTVTFCPDGNAIAPSTNTQSTYQVQWNTDFWGNDIDRFQVSGNADDQVNQCSSGCDKNGECVGFSVSGGFCYLKNALANKYSASGVTAGIRPGNGACTPAEWNTDYYGNDFARYWVSGNAGEQAGQCCSQCAGVSECAAWTVNNQWCYLKKAVGSKSWSSSAFSGRRSG